MPTSSRSDIGEAMLAVVRDVYDGGNDLIPGWTLLKHATDSLRQGGPEGLKKYYERCLATTSPKAQQVKTTLERNGRKTLESERATFLAAYRSSTSN